MTDSYSLLPIDVGFDLRLHDMTTAIVCDGREYVFAGDDDDPQAIRAEWSNVDTVAETLARAGYSVRIATTDAGQRLECHPQDKAARRRAAFLYLDRANVGRANTRWQVVPGSNPGRGHSKGRNSTR